MPVELILGDPGAGKTIYTVARRMLPEIPHLDSSKYHPNEIRRIWHNIDGINERLIYWHHLTGVSMSDLTKRVIYYPQNADVWDFDYKQDLHGNNVFVFKYLHQNDILIMDEAQIAWPKSEYAGKSERASKFQAYLTQHRKFGHDILFITQHEDQISNVVLNLVEATYYLTKLKFMGSVSRYAGRIYRHGSTLDKNLVGKFSGQYNPDHFTLYSSYKVSGAKEKARKVNVFLRPKILIYFSILAFTVLFVGYRVASSGLGFDSAKKKKSNAPIERVEGVSNPVKVENEVVEVLNYVIHEDLCQAETINGIRLVPASVCAHLPYQYLGKTYKLKRQEINSGRPRNMF